MGFLLSLLAVRQNTKLLPFRRHQNLIIGFVHLRYRLVGGTVGIRGIERSFAAGIGPDEHDLVAGWHPV